MRMAIHPIHRLASCLKIRVIRHTIMSAWAIAIEEPAFVQQPNLSSIFLMESTHELITKPLGQGNPSSICSFLYVSIWGESSDCASLHENNRSTGM